MKIYESLSNVTINSMPYGETCYFKKENVSVIGCHTHGESFEFLVTDLTNAMKPKKCEGYRYTFKFDDDAANEITSPFYDSMETLIDIESHRQPYSVKGSSTFSPWAKLNPVTKMPKRWNLGHLRNLIANDQIVKAVKNGRYTDDYAFDNANDFGRGNMDPVPFVQEIVEHNGGWRIYQEAVEDNGLVRLSVCCHLFDLNTIWVDLSIKSDREEPGKVDGITVERNEAKQGIEIKFPGRPSATILNGLKDNGFRWHRARKLWYAKASEKTEQFAHSLIA